MYLFLGGCMPCPSAWTKLTFLGQDQNDFGQNEFCPSQKNS